MKNFIAAVSDDYTGRIDDLADQLRKKGCEVKRVMKLTGVITGRVNNNIDLSELKIEGIKSVEIQKRVRKI